VLLPFADLAGELFHVGVEVLSRVSVDPWADRWALLA
jgi:hypothetical protein